LPFALELLYFFDGHKYILNFQGCKLHVVIGSYKQTREQKAVMTMFAVFTSTMNVTVNLPPTYLFAHPILS